MDNRIFTTATGETHKLVLAHGATLGNDICSNCSLINYCSSRDFGEDGGLCDIIGEGLIDDDTLYNFQKI